MIDPTPTPRRTEPAAPPAIEIPGPGVYPLEERVFPCSTCHGAGRVPDENGPKVEIFYDLHDSAFRWKPADEGPLSSRISDTFPTPAEAFADAQEAYRAGR